METTTQSVSPIGEQQTDERKTIHFCHLVGSYLSLTVRDGKNEEKHFHHHRL